MPVFLTFRPYALALLLALSACQPSPPQTTALCDLGNGPCILGQQAKTIELAIEPRPIRPMQALQIKLRLPHDAQQATLRFDGMEMDMGPNQIRLQPSSPGQWTGSATIPLCMTGDMNWKATLTVSPAAGPATQHEFRFRTVAH